MQNNKRENMKRHPIVYSINDSFTILHDPNWKHGDNTYHLGPAQKLHGGVVRPFLFTAGSHKEIHYKIM